MRHQSSEAAARRGLPSFARGTLLAAASVAATVSALAAPAAVCTAPIAGASTAGALVVGNGTASSCTGAALQAAVGRVGTPTILHGTTQVNINDRSWLTKLA